MGNATLTPNADAGAAGTPAWTKSTGAVFYSLLNDASDATYAQDLGPIDSGIGGGQYFKVDLTTTTLPAGAIVKYVQATVRARQQTATYNHILSVWLYSSLYPYGSANSQSTGVLSTTISNYTLGAKTTTGLGEQWSQAYLDALELLIQHSNSGGSSEWVRVYEASVYVEWALQPTVSGITPSSNITTSRPTVAWTFTLGTDATGDQTKYEVKVFSAAQYGAGGFDPATSTPTYTSGETTSAARAHALTADLVDGTTYKVYMRVAQNTSGFDHWSDWTAGTAFAVALDKPADPDLVVSVDVNWGRADLEIQGHDNLLTETDASFEYGSNVGNWASISNSTITDLATNPKFGTRSLRQTATAGADMEIGTPSGTSGFAVVAARDYRLRAWVRSDSATRNVKIGVSWYNSSGTIIGSTTYVAASSVGTTYTELTYDVTAPTGAVYARMHAHVAAAAAAEVWYWDGFAFSETAGNAPTVWTRGGLISPHLADVAAAATKTYVLEWSEDGGTTWTTLETGLTDPAGANQYQVVYDWTIKPNVAREYRVRAMYVESGNTVNGNSVAGNASATWTPDLWFFKVLDDHNLDLTFDEVVSDGPIKYDARRGVFRPIGRAKAVTVADVRAESDGRFVFDTMDTASYEAWLDVLRSRSILLVQGPVGVDFDKYVTLGDASSDRLSDVGDVEWRRWTVEWTEVDAP